MICAVYQPGQVDYNKAYRLQIELARNRVNGSIGDVFLLLEHPPTITIGKKGDVENVVVSLDELREKGISVYFIERGGDVTYHGPGQLVGYPIIDLNYQGKDIYRYINNLEEVLIRALKDFGIESGRDHTHRGVWIGDIEIAAIGLRVSRWVTMHGFALNVNNDLEPFSLINPCGFTGRRVSSVSEILGEPVAMGAVIEKVLGHFTEIFDAQLQIVPSDIKGMASLAGAGGNVPGKGDDGSKTSPLVQAACGGPRGYGADGEDAAWTASPHHL